MVRNIHNLKITFMTALFILPDEAIREMQKTDHKFESLNGQGKEAKEYINPKVFTSDKEIEIALKDYSGNVSGAVAFNNDTKYLGENELIKKKLMPHMTIKATFDFLMGKDEDKKVIIEKVIASLAALHNSEAEADKVKGFKDLARKAVDSAKVSLGKIKNLDPQIEKKVLDAIKKVEAEINADHPSSKELKRLTDLLDVAAGELTDDTEISAARDSAKEFTVYAVKELEAKDLPLGTKELFMPKLKNLEELAKGKNPYAILAEIELLGKQLHQKTSKEVLMKDTSLNLIINSMVRMIVLHLFKITDQATFTGVIKKLISLHIDPAYKQYVAGLGRLAKSSSKSEEVYGDICFHTFSLITDELIKVNRGIKDLSITHEVPYTVPFNVVDKVFSDLQISILGLQPDKIESETERFAASEKLIEGTRNFIKGDFINNAALDESQINILINGPAFEMALGLIPTYVSKAFVASVQPAQKKAES